MDTLLRAALALPDCPLPTALPVSSSHLNHYHHQHHHYPSNPDSEFQLPDKHILAARLRTQLRRAAQRAKLYDPDRPATRARTASGVRYSSSMGMGIGMGMTAAMDGRQLHFAGYDVLHDPRLGIDLSMASTPTPTSPSCGDGDMEADADLHHDMNAFTATWTLASGPLSPPASIARFSCAPTHLVPPVTLPPAAHAGPNGVSVGPVSHHLAPECRSVASIHVVTSSSSGHPLRGLAARRPSTLAFALYGQDEDEDIGDMDCDDDHSFHHTADPSHVGWYAPAPATRSHVPHAAYAEMEEAAWTILRMMQDSQALPSHDADSPAEPSQPSSTYSLPSDDAEGFHSQAMQVDTLECERLATRASDDDPKAQEEDNKVDNAKSHDHPVKSEPAAAASSSSPDSRDSSSPLSHRLALTRRRVQSELAHRRPSALTLSTALPAGGTPGGLGMRRGSLSSALSSPAKSATRTHFPAPLTPTMTSSSGTLGPRARRRSLTASEHLIMGQLARSPLALAFSKQQQAASQSSSSLATLTEKGPEATRESSKRSPTSPPPVPARTKDTPPSRRPLLTSASASTSSRRAAAAAGASPAPAARIPRELANLADFLKPPPAEPKMAASPLSASLLASGIPVDQVVAAVVSSTGTTAVGARRTAAGRLGTIEEATVKREADGQQELQDGLGSRMATRKRTRRAVVAHSDSDNDAAGQQVNNGVADADAMSDEDLPRATKRARRAVAPVPLTNGRSRSAAASLAVAVKDNGNGRRAPVKKAPVVPGRVTRGRAAAQASLTPDLDADSLSESAADGSDVEMDDAASLSSVPSSPEL